MKTFKAFLLENSILTEAKKFGKLKHLEHLEDLPVNNGEEGFHHAVDVLRQVHEHVKTGHSHAKVTTKYDGSPSVVFGHHPQTGKFFVASKSAFNKNPKLNYTPEDIQHHHGHATDLVDKLSHALKHLKKIAPKKGVYQGDLMYTKNDVHEEGGKYHFKPNTITYSTPKSSEEGKKISKAKMGVVVHTKYHGPTLEKMHAGFDPDIHKFKQHSDIHVISHEVGQVHHTPQNEAHFEHHLNSAVEAHRKAHIDTFHATAAHTPHLKLYINDTVRTGEKPSTEGFAKHLSKHYDKKVAELKTPKKKVERKVEQHAQIQHVQTNKKHYDTLFNIHHHLQQAKNALVSSLEAKPKYEHTINGHKTGPEGFVATLHGHPSKFVNRAEFSRQNLLKNSK